MPSKSNNKKNIVCFCNAVSEDTIIQAIKNGAQTPDEIFDRTTAGVGPCGGSCRPVIKKLLEKYIKTSKKTS